MDVGEAERAVADAAGQVNVAEAVTRVVEMTHTVFLRARPVVDFMQQVSIGEQREGAEEGGTVYCGQLGFQVGKVESVAEAVTHLFPDEHSDSCHANAGVHQRLFVVNFIVHVRRV